MRQLFLIRPLLWAGLLGLVFVGLTGSCNSKPDDMKHIGTTVTELARKNNLTGNRFRLSGAVVGEGAGVCVCIKVCDSAGKCTACVCDPGCSAGCD
jgi:hypothetical protein